MTEAGWQVHHGDCLDVLRGMADNSVDAVVTDPPYGLSFMGRKWDYDVPSVAVWSEVLRVLKPGGHLLSFGGTRTYHRLVVAIEDAGFEIRDCIAWLYGSGFPKSLNLDGERKGWGTALKPSMEPICVARKPLDGTVAANVMRWGTGAINVDGCRVKHGSDVNLFAMQRQRAEGTGHSIGKGFVGSILGKEIPTYKPAGRWPANTIHDGSDEVVGLFPVTTSGFKSGGAYARESGVHEGGQRIDGTSCYADSGSAARFFYTAKASKADREGSTHPTVKPTTLMRYLCRLVTPPNGIVLDPFTGSGSTGKAAMMEGFRFIGIEREAEYVEIAKARIANAERPLVA